MRRLVLLASVGLTLVGLFAQLSSAAFTGSTTVPSNGITADALRNYFSVSAGSDVQPGTSTAVASGNVDGLSIDLGSLTTDVVQLTVTRGSTITATRAGSAGAGTVTFSGLNLSGMSDGGVTFTVIATDLAGNVSAARTVTITKDTTAPAAPTAAYTDNNNAADVITGTAEASASISVTKTAPTPTASYSGTANGAGAYTIPVAAVNGKNNAPIAVTYTVTATDAADNTSAATTLNFSDTH
jgi:hypothetical protein